MWAMWSISGHQYNTEDWGANPCMVLLVSDEHWLKYTISPFSIIDLLFFNHSSFVVFFLPWTSRALATPGLGELPNNTADRHVNSPCVSGVTRGLSEGYLISRLSGVNLFSFKPLLICNLLQPSTASSCFLELYLDQLIGSRRNCRRSQTPQRRHH